MDLAFDDALAYAYRARKDAVLVCGGSGSGKTTFAHALARMLRADGVPATILPQDMYFRDGRQGDNFDRPEALDLDLYARQLRALLAGERVDCPVYDMATCQRAAETVPLRADGLVIAEGMFLLGYVDIVGSLGVYVHASDRVRLARRAYRDILQRGRTLPDIDAQWRESVQPMHERFVLPQRGRADVVVLNDGYL